MISQGTDGLSRGELATGVMQGEKFLDFLPLNESALQRHPTLKRTIWTWISNPQRWHFLNTQDWFDIGYLHHKAKYVWAPPPCLAQIAVKQLCEVKHMFPDSSHIFLYPSMMTGYWRKKLGKLADSMFILKSGSDVWPKSMHKSLTIAFVKSLLSNPP